MGAANGADYEVREEFLSLEEWRRWHPQHPEIASRDVRAAVLESIRRDGFHDPVSGGPAHSPDIEIGNNLREGLLYRGINSRMRAVWSEMLRIQSAAGLPDHDLRVYAPEALTDFALCLRCKYRFFLGSEYLPTAAERTAFFPILHQDLQQLMFPDASFDVAVCNEVFEHVPDLDATLRELCRILKPGGSLVGTFPFCFHDYDSLVFEIPGWNIIDRAIRSGFRSAHIVFVGSRRRGILGNSLNGVMALAAVN